MPDVLVRSFSSAFQVARFFQYYIDMRMLVDSCMGWTSGFMIMKLQ